MLNENLVKTLEKAVKDNWNGPCFTNYGGKTLTFAQAAANIKKIHQLFKCFSIEKGDKVALCGANGSNWATVYLASITYGAIIVPILVDFSSKEISHIVDHSDSKLFFVGGSLQSKLNFNSFLKIQAVVSLDDFDFLYLKNDKKRGEYYKLEERFSFNLNDKEDFFLEEIPNDAIASIVYTSGTTGFSKGVMVSHNCLLVNMLFCVDNFFVDEKGKILAFLPLAHSFGCAFDFLGQIIRGAEIIFLGKIPTPKILLKAFSETDPILILTVPLILEKIYRSKIVPILENPLVKTLLKIPLVDALLYKKIGRKINDAFGKKHYQIIVGGAPFNSKIEDFFFKCGVRFTVGYGMTECAPLIAYSVWNGKRPIGSCGKVIDSLTMRIDSPDEKGIGEICVKGENIFSGYYKMEKESAEAFDSEGWFHTGDLGYVDGDGFLFVCGRIKNMILSASGQNIYPEEIEAKLNELPYVLESLVMETRDNRLVAFVYPDKAKIEKDNLSEIQLDEIMKKNRIRLNASSPSFAKISEIKIRREGFQKTSTQKIKRGSNAALLD